MKEKRLSETDLKTYVEALQKVVDHRHLSAHVTLTNHVRLHRLLMSVLGRLLDFSGLWERDLYFVTLALIYRSGLTPHDFFTDNGLERLREGRIIDAQRRRKKSPDVSAVVSGLLEHFPCVERKPPPEAVTIRNDLAHFNMLRTGGGPLDLTACVNSARKLMEYDRKLKNAVSQSIIEMLERDGLSLQWTMGKDHRLNRADVESRSARHLGGLRYKQGKANPPIVEHLHDQKFVRMVASLFAGEVR